MLAYGTSPDKYTFPYVIKVCGRLGTVRLAKYVHCRIRDMGFEMYVYVGSALIKFYAENGCLDDARYLFDKMYERDDVLWNVILNENPVVSSVEMVNPRSFQELSVN
nr:pentatricopeptide repeat-containing protein At4g21300 [Tanacetum cinerariifolium]